MLSLWRKLTGATGAGDIDLTVGAQVFAVTRVAVLAVCGAFVLWIGGPMAGPAALILAATLVYHLVWWWFYMRRPGAVVTLRVAFAAVLVDVVAVGVGVMFTGGLDSPGLLVWPLPISSAASWIGIRWSVPLIAIVAGFCAGMAFGPMDLRSDITFTDAHRGSWTVVMLTLLSIHVAVGAKLQRNHSRVLADANARLRRDPLTGLGNRTVLDERLEDEIVRARHDGGCLTLAVLDLDDFKAVNDTHGHLVGDEVLTCFAHAIERELRSTDIAVRLGGEEFVVVCLDTEANEATKVVERIRESFAASATARGVTFSAGLVELTERYADATSLLDAADMALYRAKAEGKDRSVLANGEPAQPATV